MSKGRITEKDLADKKIFELGQKFADSLKPANDALKQLKENALAYSQIEKDFKIAPDRAKFIELLEKKNKLRIQSANAIKAEKNTLVATEKVKQAGIKTQKDKIALDDKETASKKRKIKLTAEESENLKITNRNAREAAKLSSSLSTEYEKQSLKLIRLRRTYKDVALTEGEATTRAVRLRKEIAKLDSTLKRVDGNVGQFQRSVGNYGNAMKSASGAARSMLSAMGLASGAFLFVQVMRDAVKVVREYEKSNATLTGILQVTRAETKELREESIRLGSVTVKTANEVVALQIAYARLGFSQKEILNLTEATIQGSIALNAELSETAILTGAMVNTFDDFSSTDAPKIMDILALSTAKSALNFEKLKTGLPIVAGAANAAGIPFTKLVALMGKLSDAGIDVSTSSTALRNIFIIAAKEGLNYSEIIKKIKDSQDKLTIANDEFGRRAAVSATVLAQNIDATDELNDSLLNAAGTAEGMANKELDTLDGALKLLKSAWQGIILETDEANSAGTRIKNTIKFLADNLRGIVTVLISVTGLFLAYKTVLIAMNVAMRLGTRLNALYRLSLIAMNGGIRKVIIALKAMKIATASTGIGLLLVALGSAYALWQSFKDGAEEATTKLKDFNDESERMNTIQTTITSNLNGFKKGYDRLNVASVNYNRLLDDANKKLEDQGLNHQQINAALQLIEKSKETDLTILDEQIGKAAAYTDSQKSLIKQYIIAGQEFRRQMDLNAEFIDQQNQIQNQDDIKKAAKNAKDKFNLKKFQFQQEIKLQNDLANDQEANTVDRIDAVKQANLLELELSKEKHDYLINQEGLSKDAKTLIEEQYSAELIVIEKNRQQGIENVLKGAFEKAKKRIEDEKKIQDDVFNAKVTALQQSLQAGEITVKQYEDRLLKLKQDYIVKSLQLRIDQAQKELDATDPAYKAFDEMEQTLHDLKIELSDAETANYIENLDKKLAKEQEVSAFLADQVRGASNNIARALNLDANNINALFSSITDNVDATTGKIKFDLEDALVTAGAAVAVAGDISNAVFERNIAIIDEEITANEDKYALLIAAAGEDQIQRDLLTLEAEEKRQKLEKKKRKEQVKQAKYNKAIAFNEAGISIALGIIKSLAFGPPAGFIFAALTAALGAIQLIAIANSPVPKYKKGTDFHKGGWAEVAEERPEVITEPNKAPYIVKKRSVLDLPRGTKVTRSVEDYNDLMRASIMTSLDANNNRVKDHFQTTQVFNDYSELSDLMKQNIAAVKKSKSNIIIQKQKGIDFNFEEFRLQNNDWT